MTYQQKPNEGVIFANDKKRGDSDPDGTGTATIDGIEYWLSSWNNVSQGGKPYRKMNFTKKETGASPMNQAAPDNQSAPEPDYDDDIPL